MHPVGWCHSSGHELEATEGRLHLHFTSERRRTVRWVRIQEWSGEDGSIEYLSVECRHTGSLSKASSRTRRWTIQRRTETRSSRSSGDVSHLSSNHRQGTCLRIGMVRSCSCLGLERWVFHVIDRWLSSRRWFRLVLLSFEFSFDLSNQFL